MEKTLRSSSKAIQNARLKFPVVFFPCCAGCLPTSRFCGHFPPVLSLFIYASGRDFSALTTTPRARLQLRKIMILICT